MFRPPPAIEYIKAGKQRPLAVTSSTRSGGLPTCRRWQIPARLRGDRGGCVGAPKSTPAEIIDRLNEEINAALTDPKIKERIVGHRAVGSPAEFGKIISDETE